MTITAQQVKELRERTGLGMMACRQALIEANGEAEAAIELLRKKGALKAAKRAERTAADGSVAIVVNHAATGAAMVELCCETDFVARNQEFVAAAEELAGKVMEWDLDGVGDDSAGFDPEGEIAVKQEALMAKMGEKMVFGRFARIRADEGVVGWYLHTNKKIGVIVELAVNADARGREEVATLARDICMQIASLNPMSVRPEDIPADVVEQEKAVYRDHVKDKPEDIQEKIIAGKLNSFFKDCVLLEQPFVKEPKKSVKRHIADVGKQAGGEIGIVRFVRFQVGG